MSEQLLVPSLVLLVIALAAFIVSLSRRRKSVASANVIRNVAVQLEHGANYYDIQEQVLRALKDVAPGTPVPSAAGEGGGGGGWDPMLIIKVVFSLILTLAALYVILSKGYDEDTKKWAFSVLSLVSGLWIGTATK